MFEELFRLLIVDTVIALFRDDFTGRGELADRQQKVAQMLSRLIKIAEEFNVAAAYIGKPSHSGSRWLCSYQIQKKAGGHVLPHAATRSQIFLLTFSYIDQPSLIIVIIRNTLLKILSTRNSIRAKDIVKVTYCIQ